MPVTLVAVGRLEDGEVGGGKEEQYLIRTCRSAKSKCIYVRGIKEENINI